MGKVETLRNAIQKLDELSNPAASNKTTPLRLMLKLFKQQKPKPPQHTHVISKGSSIATIETINKMRFEILRLRSGNDEEQALADSLTKKIESYNATCKKSQQLPLIELPEQKKVEYHYPQQPKNLNAKHSAVPFAHSSIAVSKQNAELFQMKALALLERFGIATNPEARGVVKSTPITAVSTGQATCTLVQTFHLFPGQTIVVKGNSELDSTSQAIKALVPETFSISISQDLDLTGFPAPLQRAGWTLGGALIPKFLQRKDLLKEVDKLIKEQQELTARLTPHGNLISYSKKILKAKQETFKKHQDELIGLHRKLMYALINAAERSDLKSVIDNYFNDLMKNANGFDQLTDAYCVIRNQFISSPQQNLIEAIIAGKSTNLGSNEAEVRLKAAKEFLTTEIERAKSSLEPNATSELQFIKSIGELIGKGSASITLQYLSEDLVYSPPCLNKFEKKLQEISIIHLQDYLEDFRSQTTVKNTYTQVQAHLAADIDALESDKFMFSTLLENYFSKRYQSLTQLELG